MARTSTRCNACTDRSGANGGNWKGGRIKHKAGYIMIRIPEHPRSHANSGYVFEHILVMENHLGRFLVPGENVHHKNGIKDDNSLSNLELWCKPQPSGIRAEDAYLHALATIKLYQPLFG